MNSNRPGEGWAPSGNLAQETPPLLRLQYMWCLDKLKGNGICDNVLVVVKY